MYKFTLLSAIFLSAMLLACKPSRDKSAAEIKNLEEDLFSEQTMTFNRAKGDSLMKLYEDFVTRFPSDSLAPVCLFKAANLSISAGDGNKSISLLDQFIQKYPDHPKASVCLFFKAFVYENLLQNLPLAKENYLLYVSKYPDGEFAKDAGMSVKNLGKSPEQMIMEFEAMQRYDSVRKADSIANLKGRNPGKIKS